MDVFATFNELLVQALLQSTTLSHYLAMAVPTIHARSHALENHAFRSSWFSSSSRDESCDCMQTSRMRSREADA
eukprot:6185528-Pleurochrysis_carterae.AAC.1